MSMETVNEKAAKIKLLVLDMDGVMTDGRITLNDQGEVVRHFHVHDGQGLIWLRETGIEVAVITTCSSDVVPLRMRMLGIEHVYRGQKNKQPAYNELLTKLNLTEQQVAYVGDDLPDLPLILRSGLGITVPNASLEVREQADWCTSLHGGRGAVREVCELLTRAQGTWLDILERHQVLQC